MPPRFDASWKAWTSYGSVESYLPDDSCDYPPCVSPEAMYDYKPSFVNPAHWNPLFTACSSQGGNLPLNLYEWGLWQDGREIDTARTTSCTLANQSADPPAQRLDFPALGSYLVTLTVTNSEGQSAYTAQQVIVRDLLVVSFGDSSASGEGNRAPTGWEDGRCHRSRASGPALAAKHLEDADPKTSVTYLDFACSGASVTNGIIGPYYGEVPPPHAVAPLEPQVDALVRAICGGRPTWRCQPSQQRPIDILTINIGVNDLGFSDLVEDCAEYHCLEEPHHWTTTLPSRLADILTHNRRAPSCETAQQRFEQIPAQGNAVTLALKQSAAADAAKKDCDTGNWGHSFEYIKDRLNDEGVKVAQTYMTTYPADFFSGGAGQAETTEGCGLLHYVGQDEAEFMTKWGYRLNEVIEDEATRLGWYPVTGVSEAFQGHGYCARKVDIHKFPPVVSDSWFVGWSESESSQNDRKGMLHPNASGQAVWAARYLAAFAAPKSLPAPESTVRVRLGAIRAFLTGIGPEPGASNGDCNGTAVSGVQVDVTADASLTEAGFAKPEAVETYAVTLKPVDFEFQPSGWYRFPDDAVLTFPLSSVDKALDVTIGSPGCNGGGGVIHVHRPRNSASGDDLAGGFDLRSSSGKTGIEVSGCVEVLPPGPQLPTLPTGLVSPCQSELLGATAQ
jgi:PKD repeat protein